MQIKILGSGGAFVDFREEYHTSALLTIPKYGDVLIDCGPTTVQSMKEKEIDYFDPLKCVLITHMHGDHIGGLEQLIYERYYMAPEPLTTFIYAHPDLAADLNLWLVLTVLPFTNRETGKNSNEVRDIFQVIPWDPDLCALGTCDLEFMRVPHCGTKKSYGLLFIDAANKVSTYWSGDTEFAPTRLFDAVDCIFHDCSFTPKYPGTVHTHYEELCGLSPKLKNKMVLIHGGVVPEGIDPEADGFIGAASKTCQFGILSVPKEEN
jgi:hydroxyacylglutathione hydrolase